jgi:hypothetical protein
LDQRGENGVPVIEQNIFKSLSHHKTGKAFLFLRNFQNEETTKKRYHNTGTIDGRCQKSLACKRNERGSF